MKHGWAIYGGLSAASFDSGAAKDARHLNLIAGVAFTGQIDALEFTAAPELVIILITKMIQMLTLMSPRCM